MSAGVPWADWLRRWHRQQGVYIKHRESAYEAMLTFLDVLRPGPITVLDLACGPGSISERVLGSRPLARSVAVDLDPVLLAVGEGALGDMGGRLRWVQADLRSPDWPSLLGEDRFDAVLSSTALHWLGPAELVTVYAQAKSLLADGGVLMNFDAFCFPRTTPRIREAVNRIDVQRQREAMDQGDEGWGNWWEALRKEPALKDAFASRDRLFARGPETENVFQPHPDADVADGPTKLTWGFHEAALLAAGFSEVVSIWQDLHKRVLLAI